jgi:hypothetical protein
LPAKAESESRIVLKTKCPADPGDFLAKWPFEPIFDTVFVHSALAKQGFLDSRGVNFV